MRCYGGSPKALYSDRPIFHVVPVSYAASLPFLARNVMMHLLICALLGQNVDQYNNNPPHDEQWLPPSEIRRLIFNVTKLEKEARRIISELRELGADENLFRLNDN